MKIDINGQYMGDIQEYVENKLKFLEPRLKKGTVVSVYVSKNKNKDLNRVKVVVPYVNAPIVIKSKDHRSLTKSIDEAKLKLKEALHREESKVKIKKGAVPYIEFLLEDQDVDLEDELDLIAE